MAQFEPMLNERQDSVSPVLLDHGIQAPVQRLNTATDGSIVGGLEMEAILWPIYAAKRGNATPWILAGLSALVVAPAFFEAMETAPALMMSYGVGGVGYYGQVKSMGVGALGPVVTQGPYVSDQ